MKTFILFLILLISPFGLGKLDNKEFNSTPVSSALVKLPTKAKAPKKVLIIQRYVDPRLQPYIDEFICECDARGLDITRGVNQLDTIDIADLSNTKKDTVVIGLTVFYQSKVTIDECFWERSSEIGKKIVVFHELGHWLKFSAKHTEYNAIMSPAYYPEFDDIFEVWYDHFLDQHIYGYIMGRKDYEKSVLNIPSTKKYTVKSKPKPKK